MREKGSRKGGGSGKTVEVVSEIDRTKKKTRAALVLALRKIGLMAESNVMNLAPVDTGFLKNSITHGLGGLNTSKSTYHADDMERKPGYGHYKGRFPVDDANHVTLYVGTNVDYAPYQELGTEKMKAQPFLRPGIEPHQAEFEKVIQDQLKEEFGL